MIDSGDHIKNTVLDSYCSGPFKGLTPNVIKLGVVSFFADVSSEMLYPLTPIFLTAVLGAPVSVVGIIEGAAEATASLMKTVSGRISDKSGKRRPFIFAGYSLSAIAKPLIAIASGWALVLLARVADRFGKGLRTSPRDALLADSVDATARGRAFGWHRAFDTMGAVVGPLLAIILISIAKDNLRLVFLIAFIPAAIGTLLVFLVKERCKKNIAPETRLDWKSLSPNFKHYIFAWGAFSIANSSDVFLILKAKHVGFSTTLVIVAYAFYNLLYAVASPFLGHLSDKIERKNVMMLGLVVFAIVYAGFAVATESWHIWALFGVYGLYMAATEGVGKALAVDLVAPENRATAIGVLGTTTGLAALVANSVAGTLWSIVGPWATFCYGAAGAIAGCMMLIGVKERPHCS